MKVTTILASIVLLACASVRAVLAAPCSVTLSRGADVAREIERIPHDRPATVCLDAGEFRLRRFLSIDRDDFTLRGRGEATVLRLEEGVESPLVVVGDHGRAAPRRAASNVTIEGLRIVGGGRRGAEHHPRHPYLTNSAVVVRGGRNVTLRNLDVSSCRSACLLTERNSRDVRIENSRASGSVWDGISLNRTSEARIIGNRIEGNRAAGITAEHLVDSVIRDNVIRDNATHGIYLSDSSRNAIADNRFAANVLSGVFLTCAVNLRDPVLCWGDSMSRSNRFEENDFVGNRTGFTVAADRAAHCRARSFEPNLSRRDLFQGNPNEEPDWARFGRCLRYASPRPSEERRAGRSAGR